MQVNSRKLIEGYYRGVGVETDEAVAGVMRVVDKLDKVDRATVLGMLADEVGLSAEQAEACVALTAISTSAGDLTAAVKGLGVSHPLLDEGLDELLRVLEGTASLQSDRLQVVADLSVARGLDYYTGTVFETRMVGFEHLGSICSGGRYDALATDGRTTYPGVGISFGVTRTLAPLLSRGLLAGVAQHADLRARRAAGRGRPARRGRDRGAAARPRRSRRGVADRAEVRQADPLRRAPRHPVRVVPAGRRVPPGPRHPHRRAGRRRSAGVGPTGGGPAPDRDRHRRHRQLTFARAPCTPYGGVPLIRTHQAGTLRAAQAGETVTLTGWVARRRDHGGVAFIDLRDASGFVQVVIRDEAVAAGLRNEFCLRVVGEVSLRPEGNANPNLPTGEIELVAAEVDVLNEAAPLPFQIDEHVEVGEEVRLKYRYLDLRRPAPAAALRLRSEVNRVAREVLHGRDFVEIETPTLTRSTPEGARDFLVPARLSPGSWYALPQSPQLFKQLLMVAGMERYFQIARCYRDEDFRADRQPEFTQLDIEMSFVDQDDVIELTEALLAAIWKLIGHEIATPLTRMTYADAMRRYGSDKPDLRFGQQLVECTEFFASTPFRVFQAPYVGAVVMPGGASQSRKELDGWQDWAKSRGARGLAYVLIGPDGELGGPTAKNLSEAEQAGLAAHVGARPGDAVFFAAGETTPSQSLLGRGPARDRPPRRADRRERVVVRVGGRRAAVRAVGQGPRLRRRRGRRRRLDRRAPRVHLAEAGVDRPVRGGRRARRWPTPTTSSATATRSAAGRSVSTAATCRSGSSR